MKVVIIAFICSDDLYGKIHETLWPLDEINHTFLKPQIWPEHFMWVKLLHNWILAIL